MDQPLKHIPPFEVKWELGIVSTLVPVSGDPSIGKPIRVTGGGLWWVYSHGNICVAHGTSDGAESARRTALAKARELGLCCWFAGEAPMAFEARWGERRYGGWALRGVDRSDACFADDSGWSVWHSGVQLRFGPATSLADAKSQALEAAALAGYRITVVGDAPQREAGDWMHHSSEPSHRYDVHDPNLALGQVIFAGPHVGYMARVVRAARRGGWDVLGLSGTRAGAMEMVDDELRRRGWLRDAAAAEDNEAKGAPFAIEPWQYWSGDGMLLVALPTGHGNVWSEMRGSGWHGTSSGPWAGWTHEPNPEFRHPDDPAYIPASLKACIEFHGADLVRRALEES